MLPVVEPDGGRPDRCRARRCPPLAGAEDVVARRETGEHVPWGRRVGRHRGSSGEDRDHGRARDGSPGARRTRGPRRRGAGRSPRAARAPTGRRGPTRASVLPWPGIREDLTSAGRRLPAPEDRGMARRGAGGPSDRFSRLPARDEWGTTSDDPTRMDGDRGGARRQRRRRGRRSRPRRREALPATDAVAIVAGERVARVDDTEPGSPGPSDPPHRRCRRPPRRRRPIRSRSPPPRFPPSARCRPTRPARRS